jgi:hypothetical protein
MNKAYRKRIRRVVLVFLVCGSLMAGGCEGTDTREQVDDTVEEMAGKKDLERYQQMKDDLGGNTERAIGAISPAGRRHGLIRVDRRLKPVGKKPLPHAPGFVLKIQQPSPKIEKRIWQTLQATGFLIKGNPLWRKQEKSRVIN